MSDLSSSTSMTRRVPTVIRPLRATDASVGHDLKTFAAMLLGLAIPMVSNAKTEIALSADAFVDSIGINIGVTNESPSPYSNIASVTESIKDLGIRHIRVSPIPNTTELKNFVAIAKGAGAKLDFLIGRSKPGQWYIDTARNVIAPKNSFKTRQDYLTPYLSALEYIEGPNESSCHAASYVCINGQTLSHPKGTIFFQNALYDTLRNAANSYDRSPPISLPLVGPSGCTNDVSAAELNGCKLDLENIHSYVDKGYGPDWGITNRSKYPGSYDYIGNADAIGGSGGTLPIMITETGYNTGTRADKGIQLPVSQLAQAKYYPRLFTTAMLTGRIQKIYTWELYDSSNGGNANASYGLVGAGPDGRTQVKKPAYFAEKNLIGLLKEPGSSFTPARLDFDISAPSQVEHLLLQKSTGDYYLLLWQELPVYRYSGGKGIDIRNQPANVTINFRKAFSSAAQNTYDKNWSFVATSIAGAKQLTIPVPDTVTILKISGL